MLDRIRIASPCSADWDLMKGDDQVRFCSHCEKHVYNLSAMSRKDAEMLLRETGASFCTRFYQRQDGTILTQDCPVGLRARAARVRRRLELAVSGFFALAGFASAQQPDPAVQTSSGAVLAGVVVDPTGAVIVNAAISITDQNHPSNAWKLRSDEKGRFRIALPQGSFTVSTQMPGFATLVKKDVKLTTESAAPLEVKLELPVAALMGEVVEVVKSPARKF